MDYTEGMDQQRLAKSSVKALRAMFGRDRTAGEGQLTLDEEAGKPASTNSEASRPLSASEVVALKLQGDHPDAQPKRHLPNS